MKENQNMEEAILNAAEELFSEKGFNATSTTEIARKVGCNQALIHYYFRTKENLFKQLYELKFLNFFQVMFNWNELSVLSFEEKIEFIIQKHFELLECNPEIPGLIIQEFSRDKNFMRRVRKKLQSMGFDPLAVIGKELEEEIRQGRIRNISLGDLIFTILSLNVSVFLLARQFMGFLGAGDNEAAKPEEFEIKYKQFIENRKREHVKILKSYLLIQ